MGKSGLRFAEKSGAQAVAKTGFAQLAAPAAVNP
jgi:hypothetical protein